MTFPEPLPHEPLRELFPDVYAVVGTYSFFPGLTIPRVMTVLRHGRELAIVNPIRLSREGEAELTKLGEIRHVLKVGDFHAYDEPWYVERHRAKLWAAPGATLGTLKAAGRLDENEALPFPGLRTFRFRLAKRPESAVLVESVGLLVTCDSLQYYRTLGGFGFSWLGEQSFGLLGFRIGMNIGPRWLTAVQPPGKAGLGPDFYRLLELPFRHLLGGHGTTCRDLAHDEVEMLVKERFPR